jgi:flagellar protein FliO/FliZ
MVKMLTVQLPKAAITLPVVMSWFLRPGVVFAAPYSGSDTENYMRMIWGLLIVLGVIFVLYGLLRKRFSLLSASPDKEIKVLEIKPLMGKKAICLVSVKGREYLLGLGGDTITHLATLPRDAEASFAETLAKTGEDSPL